MTTPPSRSSPACLSRPPRNLFTPQFLERLRQPTGALEQALRAADRTCDWRPSVPVHLYAAHGDRDVPIANTEYCRQALQTQGADVQRIDVGDVDHTTSVILSVLQVLERFDELGTSATAFTPNHSHTKED